MARLTKPSEATRELFAAVLPHDERIKTRPMFGQVSAFINGNMFAGVFGDSVFVRPNQEDREALLQSEDEAALLEPMPGRPMKEYVVLPPPWESESVRIKEWMQRALEATAALKPKEARPKASKRTQA